MSIVRVEWLDSVTPQVIGYNVYRGGVKINSTPVSIGVRVYDDDTAIKDQINTYVVQAVTADDETTDEVQGENKLSITPTQSITPKVWTLIQQNDFSVNTNGFVGFNGATVSAVGGLLEVIKTTGAPGINPSTSFVAGAVYKFVFDVVGHTSVLTNPQISYMTTWGKTFKTIKLNDVTLPLVNQEISWTHQNISLAAAIVYGNFSANEKLILDNCKLYRLI